MALRRDEDAAACAVIDAEPHWLPFVEAPHRGYRSAEALFAGPHKDDQIVDVIAPVLCDLIRSLTPDMILSPQAIGAHVDHVALHLALRSCKQPVWHWADFPYAMRADLRSSLFHNELRVMRDERVTLTPDDILAKTNATLAYASQIGFQFGGAVQARAAIASCSNVETFKVPFGVKAE